MIKLNFADPLITNLEKNNLNQALKSGWLSSGPFVNKFEKKLSKIMSNSFCISVNNGTNAILLILLMLNLKKGDEIIVPSYCYISPIHMIKMLGLVPVTVDICLDNLQIDTDKIVQKISKKTKAILLIHNYGSICDLNKIKKIVNNKNLFLIEDISEVFLSKFNNKFLGSGFGCNVNKYISYTSFHATKTLFTGEGGAIFTKSKKHYQRLQKLRNHGQNNSKVYFYDMIGGNFRLSNLLASLGYSQMLRFGDIIKKRKLCEKMYKKKLKKNKNFSLIQDLKNFSSVKWGFPIVFKNKKYRDKILNILNKNSTVCRPGFYSLNYFKYLNIKKNKFYKKSDFKNSDIATTNTIILPLHNKLTKKEIKYICEKINNFFL